LFAAQLAAVVAGLPRLLKLAGGGVVAGNCAVGLMGLAVHPPGLVQTPLLIAASLAGGSAGYLRWKAESRPSRLHGSAAFGTQRDARRELSGEGLIIGRAEAGWLMRYAGPAHPLTIAPTRAGKGVGAIISNLLTVDRAVLCIDPKGENVRAATWRRYGKCTSSTSSR
jgi:type IV secretion system protein VirD4